jgi:hypothetical protein
MTDADFYGILDGLLATSYQNAPAFWRKEATHVLFTIYDRAISTPIQDIMPRAPAPSSAGNMTPSIDSTFLMAYAADPQIMSPMSSKNSRTKPFGLSWTDEAYQARLTRQWGPIVDDPYMFEDEMKAGFLDRTKALVTETALRSIMRRVEWEDTRYVKGIAATINNYSPGVNTARKKEFDAATGTGVDEYLSGAAWDNYSSDPEHDLDKIQLYCNQMTEKEVTQGFIGPNTAFALERNSKLRGNKQYVTDITNMRIAAMVKGITLKKVMGQTIKDTTLNSNKQGYPGIGDIRPDDWTTRKKVTMMQETVGGTIYEWGLFTPGNIGNTFTARTHKNHADTNVPYGHTWRDNELDYVFSSIQLGFCPYVRDFGEVMVVTRLAEKKV